MTLRYGIPTFRDHVRGAFKCSNADYEQVVLRHTLAPLARLLSPLLLNLNPGFFEHDIEIIRDLAHCGSLQDLAEEYSKQRAYFRSQEGGLRKRFRLRIARERLLAVAQKAFACEPVLTPPFDFVAPPKTTKAAR
jgi:hypothetical protein